MSRPLVVVDTNVVVAGLLTADPQAATALVLDAMLDGRVRFVLSIELLSEYREVLLRHGIAARHGLDAEEVDELLVAIAARGVIREPIESAVGLSLPESDAHLGRLLAAAARARLVTGDRAVARTLGSRAIAPRDLITEVSR